MELRENFHESFERCVAAPGFFDRFYERIMEVAPDVGSLLENADKGVEERKRVLKSFFLSSGMSSGTTVDMEGAKRHLKSVGRWNREVGFRPNHYNLWLYCLVETVREFDKRLDDQTEQLWIDTMREAIEIVRSFDTSASQ